MSATRKPRPYDIESGSIDAIDLYQRMAKQARQEGMDKMADYFDEQVRVVKVRVSQI